MIQNKSEKARGITLVALMVLSVFAGTVSFAGAAAAQSVTTADRTLSSTSAQPGDTVTVTVDVDLDASGGVQIQDQFDPALNAQIVSGFGGLDNVDNDGGVVTFNNPTGTESSYSVEYEVTIPDSASSGTTYDFDGTVQANDSASITGDSTLTVEDQPQQATFEVSGLSPTDVTVTQGDTIDVSATIENTGSSSGAQTVEFRVMGNALDSEDVSLNAGESQDVTFSDIDTSSLAPGDYTHGVYTQDDQQTATLTVQEQISTDERVVNSGDQLFQGEGDYFLNGPDGELEPSDLQRSGGDSEGVILQEPIPEDAATGGYSSDPGSPDAFEVTVQTPRVSDLEILNENGEDVAGGTISLSNDAATVDADINFEDSEPAELTVEDSNGLDVTNTALSTGESATQTTDPARFELDLTQLESGEEYTVTVEGDDDLDFGDASVTATFEIASDEDASLTLGQGEATQGEDVNLEITGADEGDIHPVVIEGTDVRVETIDAAFRNVGDTVAVGTSGGDAVALVEIDDGIGVGQIETGALDEASIDVTLFDAVGTDAVSGISSSDLDADSEADDQTLDVTEGTVTLTSPSGSYVVGSEININGTTSAGVSDVVLYARDEGDFVQITDAINVEGDNSFEEEDVVISRSDENVIISNLLDLPGTYRIAAVDAESTSIQSEGNDDRNNDGLDDTPTTSEISQAVGTQSSLQVVDQELSTDYVGVINGQVAVEDTGTFELRGLASGQEDVNVFFVDSRGGVSYSPVSVDADDEFEEEDLLIEEDNGLSQGDVVMIVHSSSRDGEVGDGSLPGVDGTATTPDDIQDFADTLSGTQQQVLDTIVSETTEETASDDRAETFQFRFTDSQTSINTASSQGAGDATVVAGQEMTVAGVTNRQPDDNTITVEVIDGPSSAQFELESTDTWDTDGQWSVSLDTEGIEPGNYTVEASDGDSTDVRSFQVVDRQPTASVSISDQETDGTSVTVDSVELSNGGFVVIHDSSLLDGDVAGSVIGNSEYLEPGSSSDVEVSLDSELTEEQTVIAMAHQDTNGNEAYDFPDADGPYTADGEAVTDSATVTIAGQETETATTTTTTTEPTTTEPQETTEMNTEEPTETTTEGDGPGFTAVLAVLAMLGAALLVARRQN